MLAFGSRLRREPFGALVESLGTRASLVRFGPFEADLEAEALRRDGHLIHIQQQPFQILATLLECPGETVTREELRQRLWPDGTYVDFDHGLNTAIKKVRAALDDSPEHPRYVETVRGRGYRLLVPVERIERPVGEAGPGATARRRLLWLTIGAAGMAAIVAVVALTAVELSAGVERSPRVVPLTSYPGVEYQPTFSPDGSHVAFVWCRDGNHDIYVQPVGVLKPLPLTEEPEIEHSPAWSPDGRWIAFIRDPVESHRPCPRPREAPLRGSGAPRDRVRRAGRPSGSGSDSSPGPRTAGNSSCLARTTTGPRGACTSSM